MLRILGIDPGSRITGFGIIEVVNRRAGYVVSGCIRTDNDFLPDRLKIIYQGIDEIIASHEPHEVAIEEVFMQRNANAALKLGQARGAAICATVINGVPVYEYAPTQIKQAIVGKGHADKRQVQHMVRALLNLSKIPQPDAADALACALCHSHIRQTQEHVERATEIYEGGLA